MSNKYFDEEPEPTPHPRLRLWESWRKSPSVANMLVEIRRPREPFGFAPPKLWLDFVSKEGNVERQDNVDWEVELDDWLVKEGTRARDPQNEVLRFSLRLRHHLRRLLRQLGDTHFRNVFMHAIRLGPLNEHERVAAVLKDISARQFQPSELLDAALQEVDDVLKRLAQELIRLKYPRQEAETILGNAAALYLDELFRVSARQELFGRRRGFDRYTSGR